MNAESATFQIVLPPEGDVDTSSLESEDQPSSGYFSGGLSRLMYSILPAGIVLNGTSLPDFVSDISVLTDESIDTGARLGHRVAFTLGTLALGAFVLGALKRPDGTLLRRVISTSELPHLEASSDPETDWDRLLNEIQEKLHAEVTEAFDDARGEEFESGIESSFSATLAKIVDRRSDSAVDAIDRVLNTWNRDIEVSIEAIHRLGLIENRSTRKSRMRVLLGYLQNENVRIRDAACLGIASIDDPSAIDGLMAALEVETSDLLRELIQQVIEQLRNS